MIRLGTLPTDIREPYYIGYHNLIDGYYRHAWVETNVFGHSKLRFSRYADHPADPRCPECAGGGL